jgi:hypothetical protein
MIKLGGLGVRLEYITIKLRQITLAILDMQLAIGIITNMLTICRYSHTRTYNKLRESLDVLFAIGYSYDPRSLLGCALSTINVLIVLSLLVPQFYSAMIASLQLYWLYAI